MRAKNEITIHVSKRELQRADVDRFRFIFDMRRQDFRGLPKLCGTLRIVFPQSACDIFEDPAARRFCAALYRVFPYWMLFVSLSDLTLWYMTLSVLESLQIVEHAGKRRVSVDQVEAKLLVVEQIQHCARMSDRTGLDLEKFRPHLSRASRYYGELIAQFSRGSK